MATREEVLSHLDEILRPEKFSDYCPNGLQVEGRGRIESLMTGVTASQALLDCAVSAEVDAVLVHHGYFWQGEDARVTGMKAQRLRTLLRADINLFAYHLPLDAHETWGNSVQLAEQLGLEVEGLLDEKDSSLGRIGQVRDTASADALRQRFTEILGHPVLWAGPESDAPVSKIGWCTGAGQKMIEHAVRLGLDAFISGEISEPTAHVARECGIHYFACGHHATERYGVAALGAHLAEHFGVSHEFVDLPNPA